MGHEDDGKHTVIVVNEKEVCFPKDVHIATVADVLFAAELTPPASYELIRVEGHHKYGSLTDEVHVHEGERFVAVFKGPTPTS